MKSIFLTTLFLTIPFLSFSKAKDGVIMTVDGEDIPSEEFLYLYNKNNQQQENPQTLDEYLQLFEIYRLKVAEAKKQGVDTTSKFQKEMNVYRRELLEPYVADTVFFNQLVEIAAQREKEMVESSHIMFIRTNEEEKDRRSLELIDSIRTELLNGADFIQMAKTYSQDKFSSDKGGYLGFTPAGTFPYGFETAVYDTPEGEISDIVESHVGWHIVKSGGRKGIEEAGRKMKTYQEVKSDVARKVTSPFDSRYKQIRENIVKNLKAKHQEIATEGMTPEEQYQNLMAVEETYQYKTNPEYRNLVDEYVNGSLLYEVSVENIWDKAANDIEGLQNFYDKNKGSYKWENPHAKGVIVMALNDSVAQVIKGQIAGMASDTVPAYIKKNFKKEAASDRFNVSKGVNAIVDNLVFGEEVEVPVNNKFKSYFIVDGRIVEQPENLEDIKAVVINDYQEQLEKEWVDQLKQNHNVTINKKELANIRKKLK